MHTHPVLITGGAKRVGRAIAEHLANRGHPIAIHYNRSKPEAEALVQALQQRGVKACAVQADFSVPCDTGALFDRAADAVGPIHHLINAASIFTRDTLQSVTAESFFSHQQVNLLTPLRLIQSLQLHVANHRLTHASIINLGDGIKGWSMSPLFLSYTLSKLGLAELAPLLASELAPTVRINTLALGLTLAGTMDGDDVFARLAEKTPLKQTSSLEDVCQAIDYLLSATNVTGQLLSLSGGRHLSSYSPDHSCT